MKKYISVVSLSFALAAHGAIYNYTGSSYQIPDGNPNGVASAITISGSDSPLVDVTVTLNVTGGFDGDIYAYLSHNGSTVTLLNRIGVGTVNGGTSFGSSASGFVLTLGSSGSDVHWASASDLLSSGTFLADGRDISPFSSRPSFNADGTQNLDVTFGGMDPNGTWTLFFADVSSGGGIATVNGWSLGITTVPEPANIALLGFAALTGGGFCIRRCWRSKRQLLTPSGTQTCHSRSAAELAQ